MPFDRGYFDNLSEATAILSCTARSITQFLAPENDRSNMFGRFDRHRVHATWKGCCTQTIKLGTRACTTTVEQEHFRTMSAILWCVYTGERMRTDMKVPERARSLCRNFIRQHFMNCTQHRIRHEMTKYVAYRNRCGALCIQNTIHRCCYLEWQQRRMVIRNFRRKRTFQAVAGIGC